MFEKRRLAQGIRRPKAADSPLSHSLIGKRGTDRRNEGPSALTLFFRPDGARPRHSLRKLCLRVCLSLYPHACLGNSWSHIDPHDGCVQGPTLTASLPYYLYRVFFNNNLNSKVPVSISNTGSNPWHGKNWIPRGMVQNGASHIILRSIGLFEQSHWGRSAQFSQKVNNISQNG